MQEKQQEQKIKAERIGRDAQRQEEERLRREREAIAEMSCTPEEDKEE